MTGRSLALLMPFALLAGALVVPDAAVAQCRLCAAPTTEPVSETGRDDVRIEVQTSLDFDQLVLTGSASSGTAMLLPDGTARTSGSVGALSGRAMVGSIIVRGEPGRYVRIGLPGAISLYGLAGGTIRVDSLVTDLPGQPRLDAQGMLQFRFGGALHIHGNVDGDYRGDVPITVDYL
jgi:formylmethanofuran dehydrogenase subunit C